MPEIPADMAPAARVALFLEERSTRAGRPFHNPLITSWHGVELRESDLRALLAELELLRRPQPAAVWLLSEDGDADSADAFTAERDARAAAIEGAVAGLTDDDAMTEWQARDRDFAWRTSPFGIELYVDGHAQLIRIRRLEVLPAKQDPSTCEHPRTDRLLIHDRLTECGLCGTTLAVYADMRPAAPADTPPAADGTR